MISKEILDILVCPFCKANVSLKDNKKLVCSNQQCGCQYPIENDIPVMLIDKASRPCPECGMQREWNEEKETLTCSKCKSEYE